MAIGNTMSILSLFPHLSVIDISSLNCEFLTDECAYTLGSSLAFCDDEHHQWCGFSDTEARLLYTNSGNNGYAIVNIKPSLLKYGSLYIALNSDECLRQMI